MTSRPRRTLIRRTSRLWCLVAEALARGRYLLGPPEAVEASMAIKLGVCFG